MPGHGCIDNDLWKIEIIKSIEKLSVLEKGHSPTHFCHLVVSIMISKIYNKYNK